MLQNRDCQTAPPDNRWLPRRFDFTKNFLKPFLFFIKSTYYLIYHSRFIILRSVVI